MRRDLHGYRLPPQRRPVRRPEPGWQEFFDAPGTTDFPDRDQPPLPRTANLDEMLATMPPAPKRPPREPEPTNDLVNRARWWAEVQAAEDPNGGRPESTLYASLADEIERLRAELGRRST